MDHTEERRAIERATRELIGRDRFETRPTVAELCTLTGFPRWKLSHRHVDLKDAFLDEVTRKWGPRGELNPQAQEIARLREQATELRAELDVARTTVRLYAEALEELRMQLSEAQALTADHHLPRIPRH